MAIADVAKAQAYIPLDVGAVMYPADLFFILALVGAYSLSCLALTRSPLQPGPRSGLQAVLAIGVVLLIARHMGAL